MQIQQPVTYSRLSFARFQSELLSQINYIIWFPARTPQQALDLYVGPLDGVNLRITLNAVGEPVRDSLFTAAWELFTRMTVQARQRIHFDCSAVATRTMNEIKE